MKRLVEEESSEEEEFVDSIQSSGELAADLV